MTTIASLATCGAVATRLSLHSIMAGYVVRLADAFHYRDFGRSAAKYVRAGHLQTSHTWRREAIFRNETAEGDAT